MTRRLLSLAIVPVLFALQGCYAYYPATANTPTDLKAVDFKKLATMKKGEACTTHFLIFNSGSNMLSDAAKAGGLTKVHHVEYKATGNLLFSNACTVVYGE